MLDIVGGTYAEAIVHPQSDSVFGSGGRAAYALARADKRVRLHTYTDARTDEAIRSVGACTGFSVEATQIAETPSFRYLHALATPEFKLPVNRSLGIVVTADAVLRFGILEGTACVRARRVVYDPQSPFEPQDFYANGSAADELALVLNCAEARAMLALHGETDVSAQAIAQAAHARVVVLKRGAFGADVWDGSVLTHVPAYWTRRVHKVGSGDVFSAYFAQLWAVEGIEPYAAALEASRATAAYCEVGEPPTPKSLSNFNPKLISPSERCASGYAPLVYLAGPFFSLAQLWMVEETRRQLIAAGLRVFSPYHDVGRGSAADVVDLDLDGVRACDVVLAIGDGLDTGTVFEVGYARAIDKPVVFYCENEKEEDKKMMAGSDCIITADYVTAIYQTVWKAIST